MTLRLVTVRGDGPRLTTRLVLASTTGQGMPERLEALTGNNFEAAYASSITCSFSQWVEDALVAVRVGRLLRRQDRTGTTAKGGR